MANHARRPGHLGRRGRTLAPGFPRIETYVTSLGTLGMPGQIPLDDPTRDIDFCTNVTDWPIYLNDQLGDCTIAGIAHGFSAQCVYAGKPLPIFADTEIVKAYSAVSGYNGDPATDQGADMQTVLRYMREVGLTDETGKVHKAAAFGAVAHYPDVTWAARVLAVFGSLYFGINCQQATLDQFQAHEVFEWTPGSPIAGGHAVVIQRRHPGIEGIFKVVTWGATAQATRAWYRNCTEEAYAVASENFIEAAGAAVNGLDLAQLERDARSV